MTEELLPTGGEADTPGEAPDARRLREFFQGPVNVRSIALTGLFLIALFTTLRLARGLFLPIVVALLLNFVLTPLVRGLERLRIPRPLGAGLLLLGFVAAVGTGINLSLDPAQEWLRKVPRRLQRVEYEIRDLTRSVEEVSQAADQVERMTNVGGESGRTEVEVDRKPTLRESIVSGAQQFVATAAIMLILLFFLLASGEFFLRKVVRIVPTLEDKKQVVTIARHMERDISTHLLAISLINAGLGIAVGLAMWGLGMPSPVLWGIMAFAFNFVPYLGAMVGTAIVGVVAFISFDAIAISLLAPAIYFGITSLEGSLFTPIVLGRTLSLNPIVIFLGIFFWGWLWGIPGALLAVPMLLTFKIFCDHVEPLAPVGELLGR